MSMKTTLNKIRAHSPCSNGWRKLLAHLGKPQADDEPLSIVTVLDSNGLDDALWCLRAVEGHDREIRLYAVWCGRQVQHLMADPRSIAALDVAERFANGKATEAERDAAWSAAGTAAWGAAWAASAAATWAASAVSAWAAAGTAAAAAAGSAAWAASAVAAAAEAGTAEWDAAGADELRRVCSAMKE